MCAKSIFEDFKNIFKLSSSVVPIEVEIKITSRCNLNCIMCDEKDNSVNSEDELSTQELFGLFDELEQIGVKLITLSGGEPFIRSDINDLIIYLGNKKIKRQIITNGTLLNDDQILLLCKNKFNVVVSLDGSNEQIHDSIRGVKGSFNLIINNLKKFKKYIAIYGGFVSTNLVIQNKNTPDFLRYSKLMKLLDIPAGYEMCGGFKGDLGNSFIIKLNKIIGLYSEGKFGFIREFEEKMPFFNAIRDGLISPHSLSEGSFSFDLYRKHEIPCFRAIEYSIIDSKGEVYPCCFYSNLITSLGNINKNKFRDIWLGKKYADFRKKVIPVNMDFPEIKTTCESCDMFFEFKQRAELLNGEKYDF